MSHVRGRSVSSQSFVESLLPASHCSTLKDEEEEFLNLLKVLFSDKVLEDVKLEKLRALQDGNILVSENLNVITMVINSLHSLCQHLLRSSSYYVCGQVLVASTNILLSLEDTSEILELAFRHRDFLLQVSFASDSQKNVLSSPLLCSIGSQCLEEMEINMPGIICEGCIDQIWSLCRRKNVNISCIQSTVNLLSQIIKNQDAIIRNQVKSFSQEEPLKEQIPFEGVSAPHDIALYILDTLPSICPVSTYRTFSNIIEILNLQDPKIFSGVLKMWLSKLSFSSDITWLHFSLLLQHTILKGQIVLDEDKQYLFSRLCNRADHPTISPAERLLLLDWIETILQLKSSNQNYLMSPLKWLPGPFDGNDTYVKKMRILVSSTPKKNFDSVILPLVSCLRKVVAINKATQANAVVLRTLHNIHSHIRGNLSLENHSCMLVVSLLDQSLSSMRGVIDFIELIRNNDSESNLPDLLWKSIINRLISLTPKEAYCNFKWLLLCLHHVGNLDFPIGRIKSFLRYFGVLVDSCTELRSNWINANLLLSELTHILGRADIGLLYVELGHILHALSQINSANSEIDVDVCSKAKLCYAALTSLTPPKVKELFTSSDCILPPVVNVSSDVRLAAPFLQLSEPLIAIERFDACAVLNEDNVTSDDSAAYLKLDLIVKYVDETNSVLYGVTVKTHTNSNVSLPVDDVDIPSLNSNTEKKVGVKIIPLKSSPILVKFSVCYTTLTGESFFSTIPGQISVNIEDFLLPLKYESSSEFEESWEEIVNNCPGTLSTCFVPLDKKVLLDKWKNYLISNVGEYHYASIFLPPASNLLLKLRASEEIAGTQVFLVTNNIDCLPWINNYFNSLSQQL